MSKRYLIIGGGGFIGRHLTRQLMASGEHVRVLDIIARPEQTSGNVKWQQGSILNMDDLNRAMEDLSLIHI